MFITALPRDDTICFKHGGCPPTNRTGDEHAPLHDTTRLSRHGCPDTARPTRHGQHGKQDKHGRHGPRQPVQKEGPHGQLPPREPQAARKDPDTAYTAPITARKDPDTAVPTRLTRPRSRHARLDTQAVANRSVKGIGDTIGLLTLTRFFLHGAMLATGILTMHCGQ